MRQVALGLKCLGRSSAFEGLGLNFSDNTPGEPCKTSVLHSILPAPSFETYSLPELSSLPLHYCQ